MKTALLPSICVETELITEIESLLSDGESLSDFVETAVRTAVLRKRNQAAFIARGRRSLENARRTDDYIEADAVVRKLQTKLDAAKGRKIGLTR
jgi:hypothetical protein